MFLLEVLIILAASRATCMASDADTAKRLVPDPWSSWNTCTKTCGGGYRTRHQLCDPHSGTLHLCDTQRETCQTQHCPIPDLLSRENKRVFLRTSADLLGSLSGLLGHWSKWSSCSVTCGTGESTRHWICDTSGLTALIGKRSACTEHKERKKCSPGSCPIDGNWGSWSDWSMCPVTCGGHLQNRHRSCNNPVPSHGGRTCVGSNMESQNCALSACPVDGHWGSWSDWSKCPVTCGGHSQNRHRSCNNPVPSNGGRPCVGSNMETQNCALSACPVDGHWGSWSEWSKCPVTCGGHSQNRHRSCNHPVPSNGGRPCVGSNMESQNCSLSACPVDGKWSGWSEFSKCSVSCGLGTQIRSRSCSNPAPSNGGFDCPGLSAEALICSFPACVPEPRVCNKVRLMSSISHNNSFTQNGNTSCTDPSYHSSRTLIQELCNAPYTSLHISSQVIDVCNQALAFSPVVRKDDITGNTEYGILIECHGNQLKVASQDCTNNVHILDLNGPESDKYYVVDW